MRRLKEGDTAEDLVKQLSGMKPRVVNVLMTILSTAFNKDKTSGDLMIRVLQNLDEWGIYEEDIAIVFEDICGKDNLVFLVLMAATESGFFPLERLKILGADHSGKARIDAAEWETMKFLVMDKMKQFQKDGKFDDLERGGGCNGQQMDRH